MSGEMKVNGIACLPIEPEHCCRVERLPFHHRDPFDRMLVAQVLEEKMRLVTRDRALTRYGIDCSW